MKRKITILSFVVLFIACGTTTEIMGSWAKPDITKNKSYSKVFIAALTENNTVQNNLENSLAAAAQERGIETSTSAQAFKQKFTLNSKPEKNEILDMVKSKNADAIFTVSILDKETESRYVPGSSTYYAPMQYGYYGRFSTYYNSVYPMAYDPGYYVEDKIYYLESNLYDVETEELIWSAQSKTMNPSDIDSFAKDYTKTMVNNLIKEGILKE